MAESNAKEIYPPFSEIWFYFGGADLFGLPAFLLLRFVLDSKPKAEQDEEYESLAYPGQTDQDGTSLIAYLQGYVKWGKIEPFITLPPDSRAQLAKLWQQKKTRLGNYSVDVRPTRLPSELFRYTKSNQDWLQQLFAENKLYLG